MIVRRISFSRVMEPMSRYLIATGIAALALAATAAALTGARGAPVLRTYPFCARYNRPPLKSTTAGANATLVPAGARQVLLCRYSGVGRDRAKAVRLIAHRLVVDRATVDRISNQLGALGQATGAMSCPNDSGATIVAIFRYGPAPKADDPVTVDLGGCATVTNGHVTRTALGAPMLIRRLKSLASIRR